MWTAAIVVPQVGLQGPDAQPGVEVGPSVGPFAQEGLDEALGLAVSARTVGASSEMPQPQRPTGEGEQVREIGWAVVGHNGADPDIESPVVGHGPFQVTGGGVLSFVGQDFDIGQARPIVDADVDEFPASPLGSDAAIAMDAMSDANDAPELLDVQMEEVAGPAPFIAPWRLLGLEKLQPVQTSPLQNSSDGRAGHLQTTRDLRTGLSAAPQANDQLDALCVQASWAAARSRRSVLQGCSSTLAVAGQPLVDRAGTDSESLGRGGDTPLLHQDALNEQGSTTRRCSGETVEVHPGLLFGLLSASTPTASSNWTRVNNPAYL